MTPETTKLEADFLAAQLAVPAGGAILDVPCGNGRHSIELASRGFRMTGVDLSPGFLKEAREKAAGVEWVERDMRELGWVERFDAAFCWGNSFAYFDHGHCERFLAAVAKALKPGGRFILESGAVTETLLPIFQPEGAIQLGDLELRSQRAYDATEGRMDITYTFMQGDRTEVKSIHQWVHTAAEIGRMFRRAGLEPVAAYGSAQGEPFRLGSPGLVLESHRYTGG